MEKTNRTILYNNLITSTSLAKQNLKSSYAINYRRASMSDFRTIIEVILCSILIVYPPFLIILLCVMIHDPIWSWIAIPVALSPLIALALYIERKRGLPHSKTQEDSDE